MQRRKKVSQEVEQNSNFNVNVQVYLCQENYEEDFNFDCPNFNDFKSRKLSHGTEWYTVCANPHKNKNGFLAVITILTSIGIYQYRKAFPSTKEKQI